MRFLLGNAAPVEVHKLEPDGTAHPHARGELHDDWLGRGPHLVHAHDIADAPHTEFAPADGDGIVDVLRNVDHAWDYHSTAPATWVTVLDDGGDPGRAELVRRAIADHFRISEPGPDTVVALVTNAGLDFAAKQLSGAASATAVAKWVAVSASTTAPAAADTTLTGEITTAGGGLVRTAGTYAHTTGTSTYTVTVTLTANGSDALPVTLGKAAIFDAASVGNLVYEDLISPTVPLNGVGDAATLTETVTV
jgi:hypothetical protein